VLLSRTLDQRPALFRAIARHCVNQPNRRTDELKNCYARA
jgi:hypothetical protein